MTAATVHLWGTPIGYVAMDADEQFARFEFDPAFVRSGIELAPLQMPLVKDRVYQFRDLHPRSFHGLPGLLADCLPDRYGNRLIDAWLARTGRDRSSFRAVDRLCYVGRRGMGALEFEPAKFAEEREGRELEVAQLVELASLAFARADEFEARLANDQDDEALLDILSVGTSAGGARAKAVVAFDPRTQQVRSGQLNLPAGFEHWLMKFDGVELNGDWGVADPKGYGLLEFAYSNIAKACGIEMTDCRLYQENGRSHFMTRRFDRHDDGRKRFVQTFAAIAHLDYYESGANSYEQLFLTMRELGVPQRSFEQQFRRAVFNLVGCNQDDHVKNFAFEMDRRGDWDLTPAYDLCHAEGSDFTRNHQLSLNGKTNGFDRTDLDSLASYAALPQGRSRVILEQVLEAFADWEKLAEDLEIPALLAAQVSRTLRRRW
ncbi:MAG: type II toxin-antitoxin system HipA family toxin [Planctomycetota bacterium]